MASDIGTSAAKRVTPSLKVVLVLLVALASVLLVICVVAAVAPVHVARVGDSASYNCSPIGADNGPDARGNTCATHVRGRLTVATFAGFGAGLVGLLAFGVQAAAHRAPAGTEVPDGE